MYPRDRASSAGRVDHNPFTVMRRAFATNQTGDGAIAFSVPTATQPTTATAGVHELEPGKKVLIYPYGTDADNEQFRLAVQLWFPMYDKINRANTTGENVAWIPVATGIFDCTMNSAIVAAAAAGPIATGDMFCDVIANGAGVTAGLATRVGDDMISSDGDAPTKGGSTITIDTMGAKYIQFFVDKDGGAGTAAASGNALFAVI